MHAIHHTYNFLRASPHIDGATTQVPIFGANLCTNRSPSTTIQVSGEAIDVVLYIT